MISTVRGNLESRPTEIEARAGQGLGRGGIARASALAPWGSSENMTKMGLQCLCLYGIYSVAYSTANWKKAIGSLLT